MLHGFDEVAYNTMFGSAPLCEMCERSEADEYGICTQCREQMLDDEDALQDWIADEETRYKDFIVWFMDETEYRGEPFAKLEQAMQKYIGTLEYKEGMQEYAENYLTDYISWYLMWRGN